MYWDYISMGRRKRNFSCSTAAAALFCVFAAVILTTPPASCSPSSVVSETETKTIEPTNTPNKVFIRRRIFRKLMKDSSNSSVEDSSTTTTTTLEPPSPPQKSSPRPKTIYSILKRNPDATVSGKTIKSSMSSYNLLPKQKFNFQSLKTRLGLAADDSTTTTTHPPPTNTSSMVMIPLPPSQRKPYTPVIMQVSKSTTAKPETTVHTYKLNKMFVPIGIYGKVLENGTSETADISTPIPSTSIRHKGTDSGEAKSTSRSHKGIAETVDLTYSYRPKIEDVSMTTQRIDTDQISFTTQANELFDSVFGSNNALRRGDAWNKRPFSSSSGMTLMNPPSLGTPPTGTYPTRNYSPSSIVDTITDSMSRIPSLMPSLFHKGLTSLSSMTSSMRENPFVDNNFSETLAHPQKKRPKPLISTPSSYAHKIPASVPGGYIKSNSKIQHDSHTSASEVEGMNSELLKEYETLEYFRKRPHLLNQMLREHRGLVGGGVRFSKGFKPVNAPEHLAKEYYRTTTSTTDSTPEEGRRGKKLAWLLRNSNEYVTSKNDRLVRSWRSLFDSFTSPSPQSTLSNRRSILNAHWTDITKKYSKDQIDEAKDRILTLLNSGYGDEALDHIEDNELRHHESHMPPPPPLALTLTKGLSSAAAGAFKDLIKFFKLGVSVGTGQSHAPVNYEEVVDHQEEQETEWKPVRRPLISFSAGISVKNPSHHGHHHGHHHEENTHFSSSANPYIPNQYKGLKSYMDEFAVSHAPKPEVQVEYVDDGGPPPQSLDYDHVDDVVETEEPSGYSSDRIKSYADPPPPTTRTPKYNRPIYPYDAEEAYSTRYSTVKGRKPSVSDLQIADSNWKPMSSEYELVPSDVYLNTPHDPRDIAAVVKPAGISDDVIRSSLPAGLRDLPTLNYPNEYAYSSNLNTVSSYLGKNPSSASNSASFKNAMKKLRENYEVKEAAYLPPTSNYYTEAPNQLASTGFNPILTQGLSQLGQLGHLSSIRNSGLGQFSSAAAPSAQQLSAYYSPTARPIQHQSVVDHHQFSGGVLATANRINNHQQQQQSVPAYAQKDALGFSNNYNLPQNLDPDIQAILESELDKDDIPEDVRKEFLDTKREEESKKTAQQQSNRRVDVAQQTLINSILRNSRPTYSTPLVRAYTTRNQFARHQVAPLPPPVITTRFFAPVPITPTLMTAAIRNPRYQSPVPRYVIELAKKLQKDKSVQGIVRVSAKRGRGLPPIEYLYPVKA